MTIKSHDVQLVFRFSKYKEVFIVSLVSLPKNSSVIIFSPKSQYIMIPYKWDVCKKQAKILVVGQIKKGVDVPNVWRHTLYLETAWDSCYPM